MFGRHNGGPAAAAEASARRKVAPGGGARKRRLRAAEVGRRALHFARERAGEIISQIMRNKWATHIRVQLSAAPCRRAPQIVRRRVGPVARVGPAPAGRRFNSIWPIIIRVRMTIGSELSAAPVTAAATKYHQLFRLVCRNQAAFQTNSPTDQRAAPANNRWQLNASFGNKPIITRPT